MRYHRDAVLSETAAAPVPYDSDRSRRHWAVVPTQRERLFGKPEGVIEEFRELRQLEEERDREDIYYGWPLAIVRKGSGQLRVAPLIVCTLTRDEQVYRVDSEPRLNTGLLNEHFYPCETVAELNAGSRLEQSRDELVAVAEKAAKALGYDTRLTPSSLETGMPERAESLLNSAVVFRGDTDMTAHLTADLEELARRPDVKRTAARFLLQDEQVAPREANTANVLALPLNASQERALAAARSDPFTVVTGPPGTGKSQLVAAMVADAWSDDESVLVASTNNDAVDVAVRRADSIRQGLLIRTGNSDVRAGRNGYPALRDQLKGLLRRPNSSETSAWQREHVLTLARARRAQLATWDTRSSVEGKLATAMQRCIELERWLRPAGSSLEGKYASRLRRRIRAITRIPGFRSRRWRRTRRVFALNSDVDLETAKAWADASARRASVEKHLTSFSSRKHAAELDDLREADDRVTRATREFLIGILATAAREGQQAIRSAADKVNKPQKAIIEALPYLRGWACTALSIRPNFSLEPGLFDLVIVDEASQCSLAHVLPLAYRAKRLVVVGDPLQLSPVVTLHEETRERLAARHGTTHADLHRRRLSHGDDSCYSAFAARVPEPYLLAEHYRCHPEIAHFCNSEFYGGRLAVLTAIDRFAGRERGTRFVDVPGRTRAGKPSGRLNYEEADAVAAEVTRITAQDPSATIGVVTPFRAQAGHIERLLRERLSEGIRERTQLRVGTAHRFQGDERDVMVASTVLATGVPSGTAAWIEAERNLVNVAVSRAQRLLIVIGDRQYVARLGSVPTVEALFRHAQAETIFTDTDGGHPVLSAGIEALREAAQAMGAEAEPKPRVEGYEFALAIRFGGDERHILDIDTYTDELRSGRHRQLLQRDAMLAEAGHPVTRTPAWRCFHDPESVVREATSCTGLSAGDM